MRKTLAILAAILLAISLFSALIGLGGVAGAASGAGKVSSDVDVAFMAAKVLFFLSLAGGVIAICWPKENAE
ncbi:hypothetical protein [Pseudomonas prosekii]|uniref:hypothetical protein n=1 Tax=Pseudomonas prosekii TaxID=1148509 RepID=UPI0011EB5A49|nr:hypothetical protein [Pseudomonas prosekii]